MIANEKFLKQDKRFWANIRTISELLGYTVRKQKQIKIPSFSEVEKAFQEIGLDSRHIVKVNNELNSFGELLFDYFKYRAYILNQHVEPRLMDVHKAKGLFGHLSKCFDSLAVHGNIDQGGRCRRIIVPDTMMGCLKVPSPLPRPRLQTDNAISK